MLNRSRKTETQTLLTRQLSYLTCAGHDESKAFQLLRDALDGELQADADELRRYFESDEDAELPDRRFASAMPTLARLVRIARRQGTSPAGVLSNAEEVLGPLGESHRIYWAGIGAFLWYALMLLVVMCVALVVFSIFVFPALKQIFESSGSELPALTQFVMSTLGVLMDLFFFLVAGAVVALAIAAYKIRDAMKRLEPLRGFITRTPVLAFLCKAYNQALMLNLSHLLCVAGVGAAQALDEVMRMQQPGKPGFSELVAAGTGRLDILMRADPIIAALVLAQRTDTLATEIAHLSVHSQLAFAHTLARDREEFTLVAQLMVGLVVGTLVASMYLPIFGLGSIF